MSLQQITFFLSTHPNLMLSMLGEGNIISTYSNGPIYGVSLQTDLIQLVVFADA